MKFFVPILILLVQKTSRTSATTVNIYKLGTGGAEGGEKGCDDVLGSGWKPVESLKDCEAAAAQFFPSDPNFYGVQDFTDVAMVPYGCSQTFHTYLQEHQMFFNVVGAHTTKCSDASREHTCICTMQACPIGHWYDSSTTSCNLCPVGTYQDESIIAGKCKTCPSGTSYSRAGSERVIDCLELKDVPDAMLAAAYDSC